MNAPHVESLSYRVVTPPGVSFGNPPAIEGDQPAFQFRLENGFLTANLKYHFSTESEARRCVEEFLRAWELDAALKADGSEFRFEFQQAHVIDLKPVSTNKGKVVGAVAIFAVGCEAKVEVVRAAYPPTPSGLKPSLDTEAMWHRYSQYLEGRESIASMGYFCLSLLQRQAGGKSALAKQYNVGMDVLKTLGKLTSEVGDLKSARKLDQDSEVRAHTLEEVEWIKAAVKALIRRKAEYDFDPHSKLPEITKNGLSSS